MAHRTERYERRGLLAIEPRALFEFFLVDDEGPRENTTVGDAIIVDVRGPLEQRAHPWFDSYEAIVARVAAACESSAATVCLRFDSPGGDCAGCFDTPDQLREMCAQAGKRLVAYVDGDCCSAAYALACAASTIVLGTTALVGSIGVLSCREDHSAMNRARGLRVELITSGARKADGHPDAPITEQELANTQALVDSMAAVFFGLVSSARDIAAEQVAQLEARVLHGAAAVSAGLADAVGPLATALTLSSANNGDRVMASAYEKAVAALQEAAKGEDANAEAAKKALAAMGIGGGEGEGDDDKKKEGEEPADSGAAAEGESPADDDEDKKPAASAAAAYRVALRAEQRAAKLEATLRQRDEADERRTLIEGRPDLSAEMKALLQKAPIELVRETITGMPALSSSAALHTPVVTAPTRGAEQGTGASRLSPAEKAALDARMGLHAHTHRGVANTEYKLTLGVTQPQQPPQSGSNN